MEPGHTRLVALLRPPHVCPSPEESGGGPASSTLGGRLGGWRAILKGRMAPPHRTPTQALPSGLWFPPHPQGPGETISEPVLTETAWPPLSPAIPASREVSASMFDTE